MSRRFEQEEQELDKLINEYKHYKDEESKFNKSAKPLNSKIKEAMFQLDIEEYSTENWTAVISTTQSESFDNDKVLEVLKNNLSKEELKGVIRTKEYYDEDALEKLIYNNKLDATLLEPCIVKGSVVTKLNIKKNKGGKKK